MSQNEKRLLLWLARPIVRAYKSGATIHAIATAHDISSYAVEEVLRWWLRHQDTPEFETLLRGGGGEDKANDLADCHLSERQQQSSLSPMRCALHR